MILSNSWLRFVNNLKTTLSCSLTLAASPKITFPTNLKFYGMYSKLTCGCNARPQPILVPLVSSAPYANDFLLSDVILSMYSCIVSQQCLCDNDICITWCMHWMKQGLRLRATALTLYTANTSWKIVWIVTHSISHAVAEVKTLSTALFRQNYFYLMVLLWILILTRNNILQRT